MEDQNLLQKANSENQIKYRKDNNPPNINEFDKKVEPEEGMSISQIKMVDPYSKPRKQIVSRTNCNWILKRN